MKKGSPDILVNVRKHILASPELDAGFGCTAGGPADCASETLASDELNTGFGCTAGGPADCLSETLASENLEGTHAMSFISCSSADAGQFCK